MTYERKCSIVFELAKYNPKHAEADAKSFSDPHSKHQLTFQPIFIKKKSVIRNPYICQILS